MEVFCFGTYQVAAVLATKEEMHLVLLPLFQTMSDVRG